MLNVSTAPIQSAKTAPENPAVKRCHHCGGDCAGATVTGDGRTFCCAGCLTVYEMLRVGGMEEFYRLGVASGVRGRADAGGEDAFRYLDEPSVRARIVHYSDERVTRVSFRVPAIHCIACVWLLENLFRLRPGIGCSKVNFLRREVSVTFETGKVRLGEVVALMASLGYEPDLRSSDLDAAGPDPLPRRLLLQLGVAGFVFGNTMLFSIASYLGLDSLSGPAFRSLVGVISLVLSVPVVVFCAADYWKAAWRGVRSRVAVIEIPIAAGIAALFLQSVFEVVTRRGEGYFDSLAGLLFFLLCGKLFQRKTYARLAFDRDYRSFFPLAVTRLHDGSGERVALSGIAVGDRLLIRHGELVPADSKLIGGAALIDYSFVTGESQPVPRACGEVLYAGGRQAGGAIEVETIKPVSRSYLTSLWNQDGYRKESAEGVDRITNAYSRRFTWIVLVIACASAAYWMLAGDTPRGVKAFVSVLIVACPCALALAAPFTLGAAQRVLGAVGVYLKNPFVLEALARVDTVVLDKTGTLTSAQDAVLRWNGEALDPGERWLLAAVARQSAHPLSARIAGEEARGWSVAEVKDFLETPGAGISGTVEGVPVLLGSAAWLQGRGIGMSAPRDLVGGVVHVAIRGVYKGFYALEARLRPGVAELPAALTPGFQLAMLSGDNEREAARFQALFGGRAELRFEQSPADKRDYVRDLRSKGRTVLMAGDGLNDVGALREADAGIAVAEEVGAFSPASDVILAAGMVARLADILRFSSASVRLVRAGFLVSGAYNVAGVAIAASGELSPVVCAVLMPLSSVTVVAFGSLGAQWLGRRFFSKDAPVGVGGAGVMIPGRVSV